MGIPVTAWVHGIARHKLIDLWRRRGRSGRLFDSFDDPPEALHPAVNDEAESHHDLGVLLQALLAAQRLSIVDIKLEGLSVADAARREGVSESAVKVNVHRGLKRLAKLIRGTPGPNNSSRCAAWHAVASGDLECVGCCPGHDGDCLSRMGAGAEH